MYIYIYLYIYIYIYIYIYETCKSTYHNQFKLNKLRGGDQLYVLVFQIVSYSHIKFYYLICLQWFFFCSITLFFSQSNFFI